MPRKYSPVDTCHRKYWGNDIIATCWKDSERGSLGNYVVVICCIVYTLYMCVAAY